MFQFPAFAFYPYVFRIKYPYIDHCKSEAGNEIKDLTPDFANTVIKGGFPHSDIAGSKLIRSSPTLIAAYHVLHRLCMPRHPPDALKTLDHSHCRYSFHAIPKGMHCVASCVLQSKINERQKQNQTTNFSLISSLRAKSWNHPHRAA